MEPGEYDLEVTLSNLCGSVSFPFTIVSSEQGDPELEDVIVCEDGIEVVIGRRLGPGR